MEKYVHFNELDFAQDDDFIRWVKQGSTDDEDSWRKWMSEHPEKKEIIDKAKLIVNQLRFKQENSLEEKKATIWSSIENHVDQDVNKKKRVKSTAPLWKILTVAAAAVFIGFIFWPSAAGRVLVESGNEQLDVFLPDGSTVYLNKYSSLEYNKERWGEDRLVHLNGEGFFDVNHGSSFEVKTKLGDVNVLGTQFNVLLRPEILEVVCESGKVSVNTDKKKTILNPMEAVRVTQENHEKRSLLLSESRGKWRLGAYFYKEFPLELVLIDIEQVFDVKIDCSVELGTKQFTGSFNVKKLDDALKEVCWPLNLSYDISKDKVIIEKNNSRN